MPSSNSGTQEVKKKVPTWGCSPLYEQLLKWEYTRRGPLVISRVIKTLNWVIRILDKVISP